MMRGGKVNNWRLGNAPEYSDTYPLSVQKLGERWGIFSAVTGYFLPEHNDYASADSAQQALNTHMGKVNATSN